MPLTSCLALFCPEVKQEFQQEKTVTLKDIIDDNWGKLEDLTQIRSLLPEMSLNEKAVPSGHKRLLELLTMGNQNRKSKMASSAPEVADIMSSVLTSVVKLKRQSLMPSLSKRRWSQEVAECIKLECSHMGSLEEIVPCQENCRAKWWRTISGTLGSCSILSYLFDGDSFYFFRLQTFLEWLLSLICKYCMIDAIIIWKSNALEC